MSYRAIRTESSRQWQLQQSATTDSLGIRRYNDRIMVAIGTGWGFSAGDEITILLSSGKKLEAVVGDIKDDRHTCSRNKRTEENGCYLEFIVSVPDIPAAARRRGDMTFAGFEGYVVSITEFQEEIDDDEICITKILQLLEYMFSYY